MAWVPVQAGLSALPETDADILVFINDSPDATVEAISRAAFLSQAATRQRLSRLERLGFVTHRSDNRGSPGRPIHRYRLAQAGRDLFPRGHLFTLLAVLAILERDHPATYAKVFAELPAEFNRMGPDTSALSRLPVEERAAAMRDWIQRYGHLASFELTAQGGILNISHCGALASASRHPSLCESECRWLQGYFPEFDVSLGPTLATGAPRCLIRFARVVEGASED